MSADGSADSNQTLAPPRSPFGKLSNQSTSSATKRPKVAPVIEYPSSVNVPSRQVVESLFQEAMNKADGEQQALVDAGILSLEDVLLPAVAYEEERALKQVQAVIQRDHPDLTSTMVAGRKAVYDSIGSAMVAVAQSRAARKETEKEREREWAEKQAAEEEAAAKDRARQEEREALKRDVERMKRKRELKKKLPRNQEYWREVAYLMTEVAKLEKEERLWKDAEEDLKKQEEEIIKQEEQHHKETMKETVAEKSAPVQEVSQVEQAVDAVTISSIRIQQALQIVSKIVTEADQTRKDLYFRYRKEHQFQGYPGVKDPKGLLRALSQSQDPDY